LLGLAWTLSNLETRGLLSKGMPSARLVNFAILIHQGAILLLAKRLKAQKKISLQTSFIRC